MTSAIPHVFNTDMVQMHNQVLETDANVLHRVPINDIHHLKELNGDFM